MTSTAATRATKMKTGLSIALDPTKTNENAQAFKHKLSSLVVGQEDAIEAFTDIYQTFLAGLNPPNRPIGNLLLLGPTGSGKTRSVEAFAETLFNTSQAVLKVDCAEFQHSHEIAKLIGSPPGYLGHRETHPIFTQEALDAFHTDKTKLSLVLFDEIEKASDALWNLLLGVLDKGILTTGDNKKINFSKSLILMTSNLGSKEVENLLSGGMGFSPVSETDEKINKQINIAATGAAKKRFVPEFINRIDKTVVFKSLKPEHYKQILEIELGLIQKRILQSDTPFVFNCTDKTKLFLLENGADTRYGARDLKRALERFLIRQISSLIITKQIKLGDFIRIDFNEDKLSFTKEAEGALIPSSHELIERESRYTPISW